jgi:hypothetical protein
LAGAREEPLPSRRRGPDIGHSRKIPAIRCQPQLRPDWNILFGREELGR